jgi:molybdenum-dependent DNA-binding transcriptional regulator ModE
MKQRPYNKDRKRRMQRQSLAGLKTIVESGSLSAAAAAYELLERAQKNK